MSRLGERNPDWYGPHAGRLAKAVHGDFHDAVFEATYGLYDKDDEPTKENPLPAGPDSRWYIEVGGKGKHRSSPPEWLLDAFQHGVDVRNDVRRVIDAWRRLQDWEPSGRVLYRVIFVDCIAILPQPNERSGWKHHDKRYKRQRSLAWEIIAVLAVEAPILAMAMKADAVDRKAVSWANNLGLLPEEMDLGD